MFTLDTYVLVKCTHFIVWISDGHRGYSLRPISLCFALLCFAFSYWKWWRNWWRDVVRVNVNNPAVSKIYDV